MNTSQKLHLNWMKSNNFQILALFSLLFYFLSKTIADRGNLPTYYQMLSTQYIQLENKSNCMKNKNSIYFSNMQKIQNLGPF